MTRSVMVITRFFMASERCSFRLEPCHRKTTFLTSLLHWLAPPESITAVNNALTKLNNLDLRWHGSSLKEQRSDGMKNRVITITERIVLVVATSTSQAPIL